MHGAVYIAQSLQHNRNLYKALYLMTLICESEWTRIKKQTNKQNPTLNWPYVNVDAMHERAGSRVGVYIPQEVKRKPGLCTDVD